jgi:glycosyltransferase involved in cell wall biosynthesis
MRILNITTEFPPVVFGGLGTAVGGLVHASASSGLTVAVLLIGGVLGVSGSEYRYGYGQPAPTTPSRRHAVESGIVGPDGITFFQISPFDPAEAAIRVVEDWRPDLIHLHTAWVWPFAAAILDRTQLPMVYTVHSVDRAEYEIGQELGHILEHTIEQEIAIHRATRMIALTQNEAGLLQHYYPGSDGRIRIVGNGIDECEVARRRSQRATTTDSPMVLYTGRLVERKGIRDLVAAIPFVLERAPRTRFVFAGGPPPLSGDEVARQWLSDECQQYRDRIHFTGWLSATELARWYEAADIQIVPSRYEPFGMVVLEGMLYGLPIVAAAVGGPQEILEHDKTGLLVPAADVRALGEAILRLVQHADVRQRIGAAGAAEVRRRWLWPRLVSKMASVYREAVTSVHRQFIEECA